MTLVAVAVAVNDHVNDHVIGRERKPHLNQKGHAGAFGASPRLGVNVQRYVTVPLQTGTAIERSAAA